jgi:hypothetical protein
MVDYLVLLRHPDLAVASGKWRKVVEVTPVSVD